MPQARRRVDLFGCIDVVCITPAGILGIQVTSGSNHSSRKKKALAIPAIERWMAHAKFSVWSYSRRVVRKKDGTKSKVKRWQLREEDL